MSVPATKHVPGGHYSGRNPVPNIQRFIESLDMDKKNRDSKLDADMKANRSNGEVKDHIEGQPKGIKGSQKLVTDPTTGNEVQIENVNSDFMKAVEHPVVCISFIHSVAYVGIINILQALCTECKCGQRDCKSIEIVVALSSQY
jgi:hypothetical protein